MEGGYGQRKDGCSAVAMTTTRMYRLDRGSSGVVRGLREKNKLCKEGKKSNGRGVQPQLAC